MDLFFSTSLIKNYHCNSVCRIWMVINGWN